MRESLSVLVVGGAGYIGSHCVRALLRRDYRVVVLDDLSFGHLESIPEGVPFHQCDLGDFDRVTDLLKSENIELVMHFAAFTSVGESVTDPLKYYENNVAKTISLFRAMESVGVKRFIFSSTAAVFGDLNACPIAESANKLPINPYGQSKLDVENLIQTLCRHRGFSAAIFRYFNAAGASELDAIGEDHSPENHLIPLAIQAAMGMRGALKIFGKDYPTEDGTCLRDYVHVDDIVGAHVDVIGRLERSGVFLDYNLGTGVPNSVIQVIKAVENASGLTVPIEDAARREGDPPALFADSQKVQIELGWEPRYKDLQSIVDSAWEWHHSHPKGFERK